MNRFHLCKGAPGFPRGTGEVCTAHWGCDLLGSQVGLVFRGPGNQEWAGGLPPVLWAREQAMMLPSAGRVDLTVLALPRTGA